MSESQDNSTNYNKDNNVQEDQLSQENGNIVASSSREHAINAHSSYENEYDELIQNAVANLNKCSQAFMFDVKISDFLQLHHLDADKSLCQVEDSLLSLSSTEMADDIFFCCVLELKFEEKSIFVSRYFEYGSFCGFYKAEVHDVIKSVHSLETLIPYAVYTTEDVFYEKKRDKLKFASRKSKEHPKYAAFQRILYTRKTGVNEKIKFLSSSFNSNEKVSLLFVMCYCLHKKQYWKDRQDSAGNSKQRYFILENTENSEFWEKKLDSYVSKNLRTSSSRNLFAIENSEEVLNIEDQFFIISAIPNFHKWNWNGKETIRIKAEQRFSNSCRCFPGSPRNRIIQACCFREESYGVVESSLLSILGVDIVYEYPPSRKKRKVAFKNEIGVGQRMVPEDCIEDINIEPGDALATNGDASSDVENIEDINIEPVDALATNGDASSDVENIEDINVEPVDTLATNGDANSDVENATVNENDLSSENIVDGNGCEHVLLPQSSRNMTLYQYFSNCLFRSGKISWRIYTESSQVVVMNNYDCETGDFIAGEYVHTSGNLTSNVLTFKCSCMAFSISRCSGTTNELTNACCHTRMLKDLFEVSIVRGDNTRLPHGINLEKLNEWISGHSLPVVELDTKSNNVRKFSVASSDNVAFVSVYRVSKTQRKIVQCHSSQCKANIGNTRHIDTLNDRKAKLCPHLGKFKEFFQTDISFVNDRQCDSTAFEKNEDFLPDEKWEDVFDESTGKWKFGKNAPSTQLVDSDPFSPFLIHCAKSRRKFDLMDDDEELCFAPRIPTHPCQCEAGWVSEDYPEGIIIFTEMTTLFSSSCAKTCAVYHRQCINKECTIRWTGEAQYIFRLTKTTCAGYEIGWEFVDFVMNGRNTFSGFVNCYTDRYRRFGCEKPFMSKRLFIDWFFAWASHMDLEFREQCRGCNGVSDVIACDGTRLGIGFRNTFVSPIETPETTEVLLTKLKRYDRTFIYNPSNDDVVCQQYASARKWLLSISEALLNDNQNFFIDEDNRPFIENLHFFLPEESLLAFEKLLSLDIQPDLKKKYARVFGMLSRDSSLDAALPLCVAQRVIDFCSNPDLFVLNDFIFQVAHFNVEFAELVQYAAVDGIVPQDVLSLLLYCAKFVVNMHKEDTEPDIPIPVDGTYNPPKYGRAYYFTEHGCQIRKMRRFTVDKKSGNFDDAPSAQCNKNFHLGKPGVSFLFLWFCPKHGHCLE